VEILVEDRHKGRWRGRTRTNKLVFFDADPRQPCPDPTALSRPDRAGGPGGNDDRDWRGQLVKVRIAWAGPWSMIGSLAPQPELMLPVS
jgi:tRNA-2-methylthio-N6-dimethylallyladenosine synthase